MAKPKKEAKPKKDEDARLEPKALKEKKEEERLAPSDSPEEAKQDEPFDYLRQFQHRKGALPGSKESDPQPGSKAEIMKGKLLEQPKVRIIVHNPGGAKGVLFSVNLNGYRLDLPVEAYIDLPEQIADEIMNSQKQTTFALERFRISGNEEAFR